MKHMHVAGRRSFVRKAGAALSATAAAVFSWSSERTPHDGDETKTRLARLEDVNAVRQLHEAYARHLHARAYADVVDLFADDASVELDGGVFVGKDQGIRRLYVDHSHTLLQRHTHLPDVIEIAADRRTATARFRCVVRAETAIAPACALVEMARQQGGGVITRTEAGVFENVYAREAEGWKIKRLAYRAEQQTGSRT